MTLPDWLFSAIAQSSESSSSRSAQPAMAPPNRSHPTSNPQTPLLPAHPSSLVRRRITQASYLYPIRGVFHFITHRYLWAFLRSRLVPAILLSTFVLFTLFFWTYLPQTLFLTIFHGRQGALVNAAFLVLGEGAAVTAILFECFFVDDCLSGVFDAVLTEKGCVELVRNARHVLDQDETNTNTNTNSSAVGAPLNPRTRLGTHHPSFPASSVYSPFSLRQIVEFILLLPLNLIPWIGVPLFLWGTGYRAGPLQHWRYYELRGLKKKERKAEIRARRGGYTGFGCVALVLQLVPILSMLFLLTTAAGSALWAAEIEKEEGRLRIEGEEGPPPEYTEYVDNPV